MGIDYTCFEPHVVYTNGGKPTKEVVVTIKNDCGGTVQVYVVEPSGDHLTDKEIGPPGGKVALTVPKDHSVHVFCKDGDNHQNGCNVTVEDA